MYVNLITILNYNSKMKINKQSSITDKSQPSKTSQSKPTIPAFPVKNLGTPLGYIFTLYCLIIQLSWPFFMFKGPMYNVLNQLLYFSCHLIDYLTSNSLQFNLMIMDKNGYDGKYEFKKALIGLVFKRFLSGMIVPYMFKGYEAYLNINLVLIVLLNLGIIEIYFTIIHKSLHIYFPEVHKLHHCCLRTSFTSNIIITNLDSALEIGFPIVLSAFICTYLFNDVFAFVVCFSITNAWYSINHDEYIRLPHWYHHKYINSNYSVYVKTTDLASNDRIKEAMIFE